MFSQILIVGACFSIVLYASGMAVACAIPILKVLHTKLFQLEKWMNVNFGPAFSSWIHRQQFCVSNTSFLQLKHLI